MSGPPRCSFFGTRQACHRRGPSSWQSEAGVCSTTSGTLASVAEQKREVSIGCHRCERAVSSLGCRRISALAKCLGRWRRLCWGSSCGLLVAMMDVVGRNGTACIHLEKDGAEPPRHCRRSLDLLRAGGATRRGQRSRRGRRQGQAPSCAMSCSSPGQIKSRSQSASSSGGTSGCSCHHRESDS